MTALHTLAAFVILGSAAPSQATADCDPTDHGCKARRSELRAASAIEPDHRATYLRSAHLSYLSLFEKTGDVRDLCSARRAFDASLAIKGQSADERARTRRLRGELVAYEKKSTTPCEGVKKRQRVSRSDAPIVAASATSPAPPLVVSPAHKADSTNETPPLLTSSASPEPSPPVIHPSPPSATGPRPEEALR